MLLIGVIATIGCGEDTAIRSYTVAKQSSADRDAPSDTATAAGKPAQLLGVIVPHQESAWFFKMTDEPERIQKLTDDFMSLASSLTFSPDGTPQWNLADGWEQRVMKQITYAQFSNADGATVTLTQLGANTKDSTQWQNYLKDNINRWRQQLGLDPQDWTTIEPALEEVPSHSTETAKAYFVSLVGRQAASGAGAMRGAVPPAMRSADDGRSASSKTSSTPPDSQTDSTRPRLTYSVPESWLEQPASGIRLASFQIPAKKDSDAKDSDPSNSSTADISTAGSSTADSSTADSLTADAGTVVVAVAGGQMEQSMAMWMRQVGLEPVEDQVKRLIQNAVSLTAPLGDYQCFTIEGTSLPSDGQIAVVIRVAVIPLNERESLFVKMTGPKELIAAESKTLDQFVQSLQWQ